MRHLLIPLLVAAALPMSAAVKPSPTPDNLERELQLKLIQTRARLLREEPSLAKRHQEIMALYQKLDQELAKHPEIMVLQQKLDKLPKK